MIDEKANELGRLLGQSTEYKAMRRAEESLKEDKEAQTRLETISKLTQDFDAMIAKGETPDETKAKDYETTLREFELSPTGQAYLVARTNVDKLMQKVNEKIGEGIQKGATSGIITL
jgi:cell fate (sporulation/competence/biofilm development) regulator YlbF (YheA/YmcA/DUF963 family)